MVEERGGWFIKNIKDAMWMRTEPFGNNPVLDYTATAHLMETEHGCNIRVLSTWGSRLEAVGLWYDQLLSESLGKHERGATPTMVNGTPLMFKSRPRTLASAPYRLSHRPWLITTT